MQNPPLMIDRVILAAAIVLTAVLFLPSAADPVNVIKLAALEVCAGALLALAAVRVIRTRVARMPSGPAAIAGVLLLLAFVAAAVNAPVTSTAVVGAYGRNSGLLAYASVLVLFLVGLRVLDRSSAWVPLLGLIVGGVFTASYGLLQYAGIDAIAWSNPFNPIIAALGNPNFAAAYLGICAPAAVWGALWTQWSTIWRVASGATALLCLVVALLSRASQGPLAAGAGLTVLAVAWLLGRPPAQRRAALPAVGAAVAAGVAFVVAGIAGLLPVGLADVGTRSRQWYWEAALSMWRDNPVLGVGLEMYGGYWRSERSVEATRALGGTSFTDSAHSVPLHLLATGGAVLALAYALFVAVVLVALVSGLRRLEGQDRLLIGALGGAWVAYHVQSLVSIDQVPLLVTQYVLAAGIVTAAGRERLREIRLPGAPAAPVSNPQVARQGKRRPRTLAPRRRTPTPLDHALTAAVVLAALAVTWPALAPLRASLAAYDGDVARQQGDVSTALEEYRQASDLVPGESTYWLRQAQLLQQAQQPELAWQPLQRAAANDPFSIAAVRTAAAYASTLGELDQARRLYDRAVEIDPYSKETAVPAAQFFIGRGDFERAAQVLEQAAEALPGVVELWLLLGDARAAQGDEEAAIAAYGRALELEPTQPKALREIAELRAEAS